MEIEKEQKAHDIIEQAKSRAREIMNEAYEDAQIGMEKTLRETGIWVRQTRHGVNPIVRVVQNVACDMNAPGRKTMDFLLGSAKECYCCSFIRGILYGIAAATLIFSIILLAAR